MSKLEKTICHTCNSPVYKKATMDNICTICWNKKSKLFVVPTK